MLLQVFGDKYHMSLLQTMLRGHVHIHVATNNELVGGFLYEFINVISWQFDNYWPK